MKINKVPNIEYNLYEDLAILNRGFRILEYHYKYRKYYPSNITIFKPIYYFTDSYTLAGDRTFMYYGTKIQIWLK